MQVGAHDGVYADPINALVLKYGLTGYTIEPQPDVFEKLRKTYAGTHVTCVNVAIAPTRGQQKLYRFKVSERNGANYNRVTGIASFRADILQKTIQSKIPKGAKPTDYIETVFVPTIPLSDFGHPQIYQIDCG